MMLNRMEDKQIPIFGYAQINIFTCIGVDFAESKIVIKDNNPLFYS